MAFWSSPAADPKRSYRFLLNIGGLPQFIAKSAQKPKMNITKTTHKYINNSFHFPGGIEWEPITVTLVDPVSPDATATLQDIILASGYEFPLDPNNFTSISKERAVSALGRVIISQIGTNVNQVIEEWELVNAWIENIDYGDLSYDSEDMTEISITLAYDYAQVSTANPGVPL